MEPTTLKLHHIVILVKDLQKAIDDYVKLGFTVASGGVHFGGISQNALILLEDATYLELLAIRPGIKTFLLKALYKTGILGLFRKSKFGMAYRFYGRAFDSNEGIIDFALLSDDLSGDISRIRKQGIFLTKPLSAGRHRPDGNVLRWKMLTPDIKELPFLITDLKPHITPDPKAFKHANGVSGLEGLALVIPEHSYQTMQDFQNLLGEAPTFTERPNHTICRFALNNHFIDLIIPRESWEEKQNFRKHGLGLYTLKFKCSARPLNWDLKLSHGLMIFD